MRYWVAAALLAIATNAGATDAQALYAEYCQGCHGPAAAGFEEFSSTRDEFRAILDGETGLQMPDFFGVFVPEESAALYDYLRSAAP